MKKVRITVPHNPEDPADELRIAARVRRDLWAHSPVEVDPSGSMHGTQRDSRRNAYFEFSTNFADEVKPALDRLGYGPPITVTVLDGDVGFECINCGNVSGPEQLTVCPNCSFRDISPCPHCRQEIAREAYGSVSGDVFSCPMCHRRVRMRMQDPPFDSSGHYREPLVVVDPL